MLRTELAKHAYRVLRERGVTTARFCVNNTKTGLRYEDDAVAVAIHYMGGHTVDGATWGKKTHTFVIQELLNIWVKGVVNPYDHECFMCYGEQDKKDRYFGNYEPYQAEGQRFALEHLRRLNVLDYFVDEVFSDV